MTLGEKIQQLRKVSGLSQEQLAEMVGVSRQAISKWETDQSSPEIEKVLLLSKIFSISTDELLGNIFTANTELSAPQMNDVIQSNTKKRQFTIGWITTVFGIFLLVLEFFSLMYLQHVERTVYQSWNPNVMEYTMYAPMPAIFAVTAIIIIIGIGLIVFSSIRNEKK